jgi:chemotaxis signal transduction protein
MQFGRQALALPVDDLQGIHRHSAEDLQPLPATLVESRHRYMRGLLVVGEQRIGCLDEELIGHQLNGALR